MNDNVKTPEQVAQEAAALAERKQAEKAAQAEQKAAEKAANAERKAAEAAERKAQKEAEAEAKKAQREANKAAAEAEKQAKRDAAALAKEQAKADREAAKAAKVLQERNGMKRPSAGTIGGRIWQAIDDQSAAIGAVPKIKDLLESPALSGELAVNVRTIYSRWRKFNGVAGRIE